MFEESKVFVLELPLQTSLDDESELETRTDAARHIRNACIGEALNRARLLRDSKRCKRARSLAKKGKNKPLVGSLYQEAKRQFGFSDYALQAFARKTVQPCWIRDHLDAHTIQKQATLAFQAVEAYAYGRRGRPRFRSKQRYRSIEGKSNQAGIRWKDDRVLWKSPNGRLLQLKPLFDPRDKHRLQQHALSCKVKYVRLLWKRIRGKKRWFVQLVLQGRPLQKRQYTSQQPTIVGIDIGPSTLAIVSKNHADLRLFCPQVQDQSKEIALMQRKLDRSRRKTNPKNFLADGRVCKGPKKWIFSHRYKRLSSLLEEKQRRMAAQRKQEHGFLANQTLSLGKRIRMEKLSYRAFQKNFGRSIARRAPGMFVSILRRKAESAGGKVEEFSTYKTALSQTCHCGKIKKKSLSNRWHDCCCGTSAQRDLYSAFLAQFVENDHLDTRQAMQAWPAAEPLLEHAVSRCLQQAKESLKPFHFGFSRRQSLSHAKDCLCGVEALDVVGDQSREPKRDATIAIRTPWL